MDRLHVATLNILNLADRWPERLPLILADMAALQPDLLGLQEVVYVMQQDRLIGAAGEGRYAAIRGMGRPAGVRQQPARPGAAGRAGTSTGSTSDSSARPTGPSSTCRAESTVLVGGHPPPPRARRRRRARRPGRRVARLAGAAVPSRRRRRDGRFQRGPRRAGVRTDGRGGLPVGIRRGPTERSRRSPGHPGCRRRRWTRTANPIASTTSGSAARSASTRPGSRSTGPTRMTRRSTRATTSGSSARLEVG